MRHWTRQSKGLWIGLLCLLVVALGGVALAGAEPVKWEGMEEATLAGAQDQAQALQMVEQSWEAAAQDRDMMLPGPLCEYLFAHTWALTQEGSLYYYVELPKMGGLKARSLPVYKGEEPGVYLLSFVTAVAEMMDALPPDEEPVRGRLPAEGASAPAELAAQVAQAAGDYETWLHSAMTETKAYAALTRLLLDRSESADTWKRADFVDKNHRPLFAAARKTQKRGNENSTVKLLQKALIEQGYLSGKADGSFGKATAAAVEAYQQAMGFAVTGELTPQEQRVLLDEPEPVSLAQEALQSTGATDLADAWWEDYLRSLREIQWQGGTLRFLQPDNGGIGDVLYQQTVEGYNSAAYGTDAFSQKLLEQAEALGEGRDRQRVEIRCCLQPLLEGGDVTAIVEDAALTALADGFRGFASPLDAALSQALQYAADHLPPLPFPKNGVLQKFPSGGSRFVIRNGNSVPLYAKVYQVSSTTDLSTDVLVGTMFIEANSSASTKIQPGYYHVHYGTGETWYGEEAMFGDAGWYNCCEESYQFQRNYEHTLKIQISDGEEGQGTSYIPIGPDSM